MKLPNRYGSIYKKSGNRRKPWVIVVTTGWNEEGKQIRKILGYASSHPKALKILAEYNGDPYNLNYKNVTFAEVWEKVHESLENLVKNEKMSVSNLNCLTLTYKNHCQPLYKEKIMELKLKTMQEIIDNSNLGYSGKGYIKTVCKKIFDYAITQYEFPLNENPANKLSTGENKKSNKHKPFTEEEIEILWKNENNDLVKILLILLYTGLRPNEIFITKKSNIFIDEDYFITGSKTESGKNRIIPIHQKIKHIIIYFYNYDCELPYTKIFKKFNYGKFSRETTKLMEELNLKHTPYDCRHTFITKMKKANANEYILKKIVGHSINDITEKVYTHRDVTELLKEINKIT